MGQPSTPRRIAVSLRALLPALAALGATSALAQDSAFRRDFGLEQLFSSGIRVGGLAFVDEDTDDVYGGLPLVGADLKLHLFQLPLAVQTSVDFAGGDGDPGLEGGGVLASDADLSLFNWRLTLLVEPPPATLGSPYGDFWVQPYIGAGVGLHYVDEEIRTFTGVSRSRDRSSELGPGFHVVGGIDFVFGYHFATGVEVLYTNADIEGSLDRLDFDAVAVAATFRIVF